MPCTTGTVRTRLISSHRKRLLVSDAHWRSESQLYRRLLLPSTSFISRHRSHVADWSGAHGRAWEMKWCRMGFLYGNESEGERHYKVVVVLINWMMNSCGIVRRSTSWWLVYYFIVFKKDKRKLNREWQARSVHQHRAELWRSRATANDAAVIIPTAMARRTNGDGELGPWACPL